MVGLGWGIGFGLGSTAMAGDLCSSFLKRRLGLPPHARASGLDQLPESLLPLLVFRDPLALTLADIAVIAGLFLVGEMFLSRLLFKIHLRDRPY
jgi:CDP-2,3-bis-(O-geranylgeranyl)-sn-glycerol synthase